MAIVRFEWWYLCLHQARVASVMFTACPFIYPSVYPLVNMVFWKRVNRVWRKWAQVVHGARVWNGQYRGSRGHRLRSHEARIGHRNTFRWDISRTVRWILVRLILCCIFTMLGFFFCGLFYLLLCVECAVTPSCSLICLTLAGFCKTGWVGAVTAYSMQKNKLRQLQSTWKRSLGW